MADTMIFLKLTFSDATVVEGTSEVLDFKGQIEIETFNWSVKSTAPSLKSQDKPKSGSELTMENITLEKSYDRASPLLALNAANRKVVSSAVLTFANVAIEDDGQHTSKVLEMTMNDGYIADVKISVQESGKSATVKEELTLSFRKLKMTYSPRQSSGSTRRGGIMEFAHEMPAIGH